MKMWKKIVLVLTFSVSALCAQGKEKFGMGFQLGSPTALNFKYWLDGSHALDFALGSGYGHGGYGDSRCNGRGYYNDNTHYCNDQYDRYDYYGHNGWEGLHFHADYLIHNFSVFHTSERLALYYGPGFSLDTYGGNNNFFAGLRGMFGIDWMPRAIPFDFFFELGPHLNVIPFFDLGFDAGIGARFWF